jgi:membrane protease YdiL (CAAX protease family)
LVEELFFRGLVQTRLVERFGPFAGIAVASLLFGAAHLTAWNGWRTFVYAWAVAAGGVVLGLLRYLTGRLGPGIVAHAFFNAQAMLAVALLT